ncbi:Cell division topological specificity factor [Aquicella siphonis]|uniref:Cell division topological specificity factor n=1 Tax=Aquicella siphonis TaxID=254247 RepID=A0A5E4PE66_9COXI|nr:cell division topological specificity factor MinE [Aquicella siphonis]VVC75269.1 Cell division topological specificity factor [Aquicella siphonis]
MSIQLQLNKILNYFRRPEETAKCAKERLQIIIAHERGERDKPDYLPSLQQDLLDVISKYVSIKKDDVKIELERQEGCSILELNVVLPSAQKK